MTRYLKFCLVFLMFAIPAIGFIVTDNNTVVKGENRVINQFPKVYSDRFFSQLVNWFNDRLLFKLDVNENLYANFHEYFNDFNVSSTQFSVAGNSGWLFAGDLSDFVYSQHTKDLKFNPNQIQKKLFTLQAIRDSLLEICTLLLAQINMVYILSTWIRIFYSQENLGFLIK